MCVTALPVSYRANVLSSAIQAKAHAKLNLSLSVLGRRSDGFHDLRSLVLGLDLCDQLQLMETDQPGIELRCSDPTLEATSNLAAKAAQAIAQAFDIEPNIAIDLQKSIPVGGGLGGGSSDAAATLLLCDRLWKLGLDKAKLEEIAAKLGSDVPLFFTLPSAIITGRGEQVEPIAMTWSGWALLIGIDQIVSTAKVYDQLLPDECSCSASDLESNIASAETAADIMSLAKNDLRSAVFRVSPHLAAMYGKLLENGLGPIEVCGAGSTLFRLFDHQREANQAADLISQLKLGVNTTVTAAPVGGVSLTN